MPTLKANGIEIYYEIKGQGPTITMIMGQACSVRQWKWMEDVLSRSFKVITFDNRGSGKSGKPDIEYSTELLAEDIYALLKELKIDKSHIFGVSVGGMIAQKFAFMFPDVTDRLVLGATMPSYYRFPPSQATIEALQSSALLSIPESVQKIMEIFYTEDFLLKKTEQAAMVKEIMIIEKEEQSLDIMYRQMGAAMEHDMSEDVRNITSPTLVISGDEDLIATIENSRYLASEIPNSTLAVISGGYHAFWIERADEACEIITSFLKQ